jgi:hypothetical protein
MDNCGNCANACFLKQNPLPRITEHGTVFCAHWVETMFWKDGCEAHIKQADVGYFYCQPQGTNKITKQNYDYETIKLLLNGTHKRERQNHYSSIDTVHSNSVDWLPIPQTNKELPKQKLKSQHTTQQALKF